MHCSRPGGLGLAGQALSHKVLRLLLPQTLAPKNPLLKAWRPKNALLKAWRLGGASRPGLEGLHNLVDFVGLQT